MQSIARSALSFLGRELKRKLTSLRPGRSQRVEHGVLRLELSDSAPWEAPDDAATLRRFQDFADRSPQPVADCFTDPGRWLEYRDRGYLDFGRGFMGYEVVDSVLEDLAQARLVFPTLQLSWRGEPLMHPEADRVLRRCLQAVAAGQFEELRLVTDGRLLSERIIDVIAEFPAAPQTWILHGNGAGAYEDQVQQNVQGLLERRGPATRVVASWVVDEHLDPFAFVEHWQAALEQPALVAGRLPERGDAIWFRRSDHARSPEIAAARERLAELAEILDIPVDSGSDRPPRCPAPFTTPTVSWDGKLVLCPWDVRLQNRVGEVTNDRLSRIWANSSALQQDRREVRAHGLPARAACRDCAFPASPNCGRFPAQT